MTYYVTIIAIDDSVYMDKFDTLQDACEFAETVAFDLSYEYKCCSITGSV